MVKKKTACGVTVPTEAGFADETLAIMQRWGADAVRDCDGTDMPEEILRSGCKVYSTYFVSRGDNEWAAAHPEECTHFFLLSAPVTATDTVCKINVMKGYFCEQVQPDYEADREKYWEVIDRTTDQVVRSYTIDPATHTVTVPQAKPFHEYTVAFLARSLWDATQMYNYITNDWHREKDMPFDARCTASRRHMLDALEEWLNAHPDTDVVRFTTFFYHFTLVFNEYRKEKYVDWFGYSGSVSVPALEAFEEEYGYRLRPEHFVDEGYYNSPFRIPSREFRDYMDFTQRFVAETARALVERVHAHGKEAMMFLGDNWIGTEPYGKYFAGIGLDAVVGSVGGGVTVRMLSDIPHVKYTEGRFLPYFFPDTFHEGGDPTAELKKNWITARRALLRKPLNRIGYGGYLSLAARFPDFVDEVARICAEFRDICSRVDGHAAEAVVRVGVLNAWGKIRSWQCYMVAHELWYKHIYSYQGILEALSGLPVSVSFLSFNEVAEGGVPGDIDVLINAGDAGTAFSGGANWLNEKLITAVRSWVYAGGGLVGVGEPSACPANGRYFQLSDVFGVEREMGCSLSTDRYNVAVKPHFITEGIAGIRYGEGMKNIYALEETEVLGMENGAVAMAAHAYGHGRAFYMAGMPYSPENSRVFYRALCYAAGKECELKRNFCESPFVECNSYSSSGQCAVVNNSDREVTTVFYDGKGRARTLTLAGGELRWIDC